MVSLRTIAVLTVLSLLCWVVFILDWQFGDTGQAPWIANGVTSCVVISIFPVLLLFSIVTARVINHWVDFLRIFGIWVAHDRYVDECERRGERPA